MKDLDQYLSIVERDSGSFGALHSVCYTYFCLGLANLRRSMFARELLSEVGLAFPVSRSSERSRTDVGIVCSCSQQIGELSGRPNPFFPDVNIPAVYSVQFIAKPVRGEGPSHKVYFRSKSTF